MFHVKLFDKRPQNFTPTSETCTGHGPQRFCKYGQTDGEFCKILIGRALKSLNEKLIATKTGKGAGVMILFVKFLLAIVALFIILLLIDLINGLRGKPTDYAATCAFIGEGFQILGAMALGVIICSLVLVFCVMMIFG